MRGRSPLLMYSSTELSCVCFASKIKILFACMTVQILSSTAVFFVAIWYHHLERTNDILVINRRDSIHYIEFGCMPVSNWFPLLSIYLMTILRYKEIKQEFLSREGPFELHGVRNWIFSVDRLLSIHTSINRLNLLGFHLLISQECRIRSYSLNLNVFLHYPILYSFGPTTLSTPPGWLGFQNTLNTFFFSIRPPFCRG